MKVSIFGLSMATAFSTATAANSQIIKEQAFIDIVQEYVRQSSMDDFDTAESALERLNPPCTLSGTYRRIAPTAPGLGHIVKYDAKKQSFDYVVVPDLNSTIRYGTRASPHQKFISPFERGNLDRQTRSALKTVGNQSHWFLPLVAKNDVTDSYTASNAYNATVEVFRHRGDRYSLIVPVDWKANVPEIVASFPVEPEKARSVAENLAFEVDFRLTPPCSVCFTGNTATFGNLSRTTISSPYDIELKNFGAYAKISAFRLIDDQTGEILGEAEFAHGE